jgi:hypothetical protein
MRMLAFDDRYCVDGAKVGHTRLSFVDPRPVAGIPITVVRTYDSRVQSREILASAEPEVRQALSSTGNLGAVVIARATGPFGLPCQVKTLFHVTQVWLSDRVYTFKLQLSNPAAWWRRVAERSTSSAARRPGEAGDPNTQVIYTSGGDVRGSTAAKTQVPSTTRPRFD